MLILRASVLLAIVGVNLRMRGTRRTAKAFQCENLKFRQPTIDESSWRTIGQICRAVNTAARNGLRAPNCLRSSLVLNYMLRRRGWDSVLRIGVKRDGELFEAHAWVELGQIAVNDTQDVAERFTPIVDLSAATAFF
jgi:hypothetical protein